ncbi:MAG: hypothetical protein JW982_16425 [Spirochaetes bacterium]|nr:hypothetical protein [Spirochaetota bacterium]
MDDKPNFGYKDQEILIGAIARHIALILRTSEGIIRGKLRITIEEMYKKNGLTLHQLKTLNETERDAYILDFISHFFPKLNLDVKRRRTLKYDCLQIYERWKEYKRQDVSEAEEYYPENLKNQQPDRLPAHEPDSGEAEDSLIHDFNKLDLEGLI